VTSSDLCMSFSQRPEIDPLSSLQLIKCMVYIDTVVVVVVVVVFVVVMYFIQSIIAI